MRQHAEQRHRRDVHHDAKTVVVPHEYAGQGAVADGRVGQQTHCEPIGTVSGAGDRRRSNFNSRTTEPSFSSSAAPGESDDLERGKRAAHEWNRRETRVRIENVSPIIRWFSVLSADENFESQILRFVVLFSETGSVRIPVGV